MGSDVIATTLKDLNIMKLAIVSIAFLLLNVSCKAIRPLNDTRSIVGIQVKGLGTSATRQQVYLVKLDDGGPLKVTQHTAISCLWPASHSRR